ncbi:hypothetical protein AS156_07165 [Bradyrhizobium macuxiense]|uniref:Uncharacterized protein n=1 Tax=Bradyrhizobium macuxiense TaxID=1755647 RepID=A0A109JTS2_9BRAD|nr:hypothetical protein [Bradyrhizobium macuxiense]KWV54734.1 hypothetical protein AS156_07165 [Bradyrhizobium macuxiense]
MTKALGTKEQKIMDYLHEHVFDPILVSPTASNSLKQGIRLTIIRMTERDAVGMVDYFWAALKGTPRSVGFAAKMKKEGFDRFEEKFEEFRDRFGNEFLRRP